MLTISADVETRSRVDLKTDGMYNYFDCPEADVLCLAYSVNDGPVELWVPGDPVPSVFRRAKRVTAWNAGFERLAFSKILGPKYGFPDIPLERWFCTAYQSRCNNMPSALGNAARCLNTEDQKDAIGDSLIKQLCIPPFNDDPSLLAQLYEYCKKDVLTEMSIARRLRMISDEELADWHTGERINDRGVRVDVDLCNAAISYAADEEAVMLAQMAEITNGEVTKVRGTKVRDWVLARISDEARSSVTDDDDKVSLDKRGRAALLEQEIPADVRSVVEIVDAVGKSSVGKFKAMRNRHSRSDGRVRGVMVTAGASTTGRASSHGIQIQNMPRDTAKDPEHVRELLMENAHADCFDDNIMTVLSSMLRPTLYPSDGHVFLDADYSSIENRVLPWLAGNGDDKLDLFRNGVDPYLVAASNIYNEPVEKGDPRRMIGKIAELALGFGGGVGAFGHMARAYGVVLPEDEIKGIVKNWRDSSLWAVEMWRELELAFITAFRNPGQFFSHGLVSYVSVKDVLAGGTTVFCVLPCGRRLTYPDVRLEASESAYGVKTEITYLRANWMPKAGERQWPRAKTYGGSLAENATQAAAASLMRWALRRLDAAGAPVVAAIHDQALVECPLDEQDHWHAVLHDAMNSAPDWAEGLPIEAEVDVRERFGK